MAVSNDEVRWAYRMLLAREPESEQVVQAQSSIENLQQLRDIFMNSPEFRARMNFDNAVGRYMEADKPHIDVECTQEQLARMLARISGEWIGFGERDPHWSVIVDEKFLMPNIRAHEDEFYQTGHPDIAQLLTMIRRNGRSSRVGKALDFGCGVGRLTLALAPHADQVLGIDISPPHLVWARERAEKSGTGNATFESISAVEDIDRFKGQDLIICMIVLQHNPPPVMAAILRRLLALLNPGGLAVFQLPTHLENYTFSATEYLQSDQPSMEMNALPQAVVFELIRRAGCSVLEVREDGRIGSTPGLSHSFLVERA